MPFRISIAQAGWLLVGALLATLVFGWAFSTAALPDTEFSTLLRISGAPYLSAFVVGGIGAGVASLLSDSSMESRASVMKVERWLFVGCVTIMATLAVSLHFGMAWALAALVAMTMLSLLGSNSRLPDFIANSVSGLCWGVAIAALVYLYMSASHPIAFTQMLTGDLRQSSLWQPAVLGLIFLCFVFAKPQITNYFSTIETAALLILLSIALVGYMPFIVSIALLTQQLVSRLGESPRLLNYFLVGSVCLFVEAIGNTQLAGNSLPLGLTLAGVFLPIIMWSLSAKESGWRFVINMIAIPIIAIALWLVFLLNYVNFIGQIV